MKDVMLVQPSDSNQRRDGNRSNGTGAMRARRCNQPGEVSASRSPQEKAGELLKGEAVEGSAGLCWAPRTMLLAGGGCQPWASACESLGRGASPAWPCPWLSQLVGSARVL